MGNNFLPIYAGFTCQAEKIIFIDPLGERKSIINKLREHWKWALIVWLEDSTRMSFHCIFNVCSYYAVHQYNAGHWDLKYEWEIITKQHAIQCDCSSCGVFVMKVR